MKVNARARTREDRAGDPLDGLVNLFDLGILLAVGFLLAALASLDISPSAVQRAEPGEIVVKPGEEVTAIELAPGERTEGPGEEVGRVYRLEDGRTIVVRPR